MTKEKAREYLIDISYKLGNMSVEYLTEKDGEKMREAIEILESEPQWIPADERLPETEDYYLATDDAGGMRTVEISFFVPECESPWDYVNVTAWMPLPKPYQAEKEG